MLTGVAAPADGPPADGPLADGPPADAPPADWLPEAALVEVPDPAAVHPLSRARLRTAAAPRPAAARGCNLMGGGSIASQGRRAKGLMRLRRP
ncbi:hypothetical protein DWQ67_08380 [Galactobacter caseinivorans]|uniref:Uncharacterized protein n=1 Tax=Galactobacter caseinivorans TaxID=2676123 RepID=A0A496PIZ7_9MICC|nr:hypothetical protein DWQ67_08380 [Galactobacter caseinivorans]